MRLDITRYFGVQHTKLHRGMIYVIRQVNGVDVPLRLQYPLQYKVWSGCFSAI